MRMLDSCGRYEWPCCLTACWWRCGAVTWRRVWQWHNGQNVANSVVLAHRWKDDNYKSAEEVPCFSETQKLDYPLHHVPLLHTNVKLWNSVLYSHTLLLLTSVLILSSHQNRGSTVVKVLCYKSEGRWFDPSSWQWIFHWHNILAITLWSWGRLSL